MTKDRYRQQAVGGFRRPKLGKLHFESLEPRILLAADVSDSKWLHLQTLSESGLLELSSTPRLDAASSISSFHHDSLKAILPDRRLVGSQSESMGVSQSQVDSVLRTLTSTASSNEFFFPLGYREPAVLGTFGVNLAQSTSQIGLDDFRNDARFIGVDGTGFSAVIIDTGIDLDHPFFGPDISPVDGIADRIAFSFDFSGGNDSDASDYSGHGSNVSSIVASSDANYRGMAPGASVIHLKVFPDSGDGASFADIEEALQWTVANTATYNIASVNLSLGSGNSQRLEGGPLSDEFAALAALSVIPVVASGNDFFSLNSVQGVNELAADPNAISVGAVFDSNIGGISYASGAVANSTAADRITPFTQRHADLLDILAPGASITGANQSGGTVTMHGTSQASPHVAGIAVLTQQLAVQELGRRLTVEEFRGLMRSTGVMLNDGDDEDDNVNNTLLQFPRIDVAALAYQILQLRTGTIEGRVFEDLNGDGNSAGDPGLSGWTVFIDDNNNGVLDSVSFARSSSGVPVSISSTDTPAIRSYLSIADVAGVIEDIDVTLNISHTWNDDLRAYLISPAGVRIELFSRVGGSNDNFTNTTFDDEAATAIAAGLSPFAGSFRPEGNLSHLDGLDPNGIWTLEVCDDFNLDGGSLNSWSLTIAAVERSRVSSPSGSYKFEGLEARTHVVRQLSQSGFTQSSPAGGYFSIALTPGESRQNQEFGNWDGQPVSLLQLILPMYQYPLSSPSTLNSWWQQAFDSANATTPLTIIANPSDGPIDSSHPDFADWIQGLTLLQENPFIRVLGYVKTRLSPGSEVVRSSSEILADVELYATAFRQSNTNNSLIEGIFLDEMSSDADNVSTYTDVANGIRGNSNLAGQFIAANPGSTVPVEYLDQDTADLFIIREGTPVDLIDNIIPSYVGSPTYSSRQFGAIVYGAFGDSKLREMLREIKLRGLDYAFITDDSGDNPFDQPPTYFDELLRDIHAPYIASSAYSLEENAPAGTVLGTPVSGDPDVGQTLTYQILEGNLGNTLSIDPSTGRLQVNQSDLLDYEERTSFNLTIQATDNGIPSLSDSVTISVTLTNVNEQPTAIALSNTAVRENLVEGSIVGTLSTTDPDLDNTFTYALVLGDGDADNGSFTLDTNGNLKTAAVFDRQLQSSYSIRVRSTDQGNLSIEQVFLIDVTDATPPKITQIFAASSTWSPLFIDGLDGGGLGAGNGLGVEVASGSTIPNSGGIDRIYLHFSEPVLGFDASSVRLLGANTIDYAAGMTVAYDSASMRGVIEISRALAIDKDTLQILVSEAVVDLALNALDGDNDNLAGGALDVRFNVLVGDADNDGSVNGGDLPFFAASFNKSIGDLEYDPRADWNSDGSVNGADLPFFADNFNQSLPPMGTETFDLISLSMTLMNDELLAPPLEEVDVDTYFDRVDDELEWWWQVGEELG